MTEPLVAIIGAGPVGVTTATLLAQYGIHSVILERWKGVYPQPRAVHLDDEVYRIIERLGIGAEFAAISRPALGLRLLAPDFTVLAEFHRDPTNTRHGHPAANMFHQPTFEALLRANLQRYPEATLQVGAEVTGLTDIGGGRTRIAFSDRTDDTEHTVVCDYLLGCDGANSLVRRYIGARMRDLRFAQRWLVIDIDSAVELDQWPGVHQVCNPHRAGTFMQCAGSHYRWEFRLLPGETAADFGTVEALRPLIDPWLGSTTNEKLRIRRVAEYTFRAQVADHWRRGGTFLLGDAAHLTPPFIGQGLCAGMRDAMNLSWKLAGVLNGSLPTDVLDTYQRERKPHAVAMIALALAIGYSMTAGGRLGDAIRRLVVPRSPLIPGLAAKVVDSATPRLTRSRLVERRRGRKDLAGSLCPNALTTSGERFDSICGKGFSVVTSVHPAQSQLALIERRHAVVHYAAPSTPLARWLARGSATAAIVRPDFTVMQMGRDLRQLCRALPSFDSDVKTTTRDGGVRFGPLD